MHSSKSWRKNAAQNIVRAGWSAYSCEEEEKRVSLCFDNDAFDKNGGFSNFSSSTPQLGFGR